jgi:hypothetical protein
MKLFGNLRRLREDLEQMGLRLDAGETAMFARSLEHLYSRIYEVVYAELKARRFFPVDSSVAAAAETYTYRMMNTVGQAALIGNFADDLPRVDVLGKEFTATIKSIGAAYGYDIMSVRRAAMSGIPLNDFKARGVRRAHEQTFDDIAAFGHTPSGLIGVLAHASIPLVTPDNAPWDLAAPLDVLADMNKLSNAPTTNTKETFGSSLRMLLDDHSFEVVSVTPMSSTGDSDKTILRHFLDNNPYVKGVDRWNKCNDAGAAGVTRIMVYPMDPDVISLIEPQPFEQLPPQFRNLEAIVPTHSRVGGALVRYPLACAYMDGTGE